MRKEFLEELEDGGWLHRPLPLHMENSMEEERRNARVLERKCLWQGEKDGIFVSGPLLYDTGRKIRISPNGRNPET